MIGLSIRIDIADSDAARNRQGDPAEEPWSL